MDVLLSSLSYEDRLSSTEQQYQMLFEAIRSGVTVFGALDHGKDFEMLHLNTAAASIDNDDVTEQKEAFIQH